MDDYQKFIHVSRYARWLDEEKRRETWPETVARYFDFFTAHLKENCNYTVSGKERKELEEAVLNMEIMPSMRALMTAGPALERSHIAGFNCAYVAIDSPRAFDETLYILMNGTGVGFSVERQYITQLPTVSERFEDSDTTIVVKDSKEGWASAYRELINLLYAGQTPKWDLSQVRAAGVRLRTFGGRASGPEPLAELFRFTCNTFRNASGRKLNSIECHDLICKVAEIVVVGGVRRSALISLSNLTDERMRNAKSGMWWDATPHRALANNSVCYTEKPDMGIFMREWHSLYDSKSGERGIFSRVAADKAVARNGRRETGHDWGTNPCSEIILRSCQFCNLTEVIARDRDTYDTLSKKVRLATILGTWQSTLTNFKYLRSKWKRNTEEERLLGVSITGIMDSYLSATDTDIDSIQADLRDLKNHAIAVNAEYSKRIGIEPSTAITCVKPSGTVSQLVDSSSGIHTRHSPYYIRTVRMDNKDPLTAFLKEQGVPNEPDVTQPGNTTVFSFPQRAPEGAVTRNNDTAIAQLERWAVFQENWTEHKPSVTVTVRENEWMKVGAWVYDELDNISGISFLPHTDHVYRQAPYQECTEEEYNKAKAAFPTINWKEFQRYETEDNTVASQELACVGNACDIVGIGS